MGKSILKAAVLGCIPVIWAGTVAADTVLKVSHQ